MILIVTETIDNSTDDVIEWVHFLKKNVKRVNLEDKININSVRYINERPVVKFTLNNGEVINSDEVTAYWYRRGDFNLIGANNYKTYIKNSTLQNVVNQNLKNEVITIRDLLYYITENKKNSIGSYYTADNNKLIHIAIAKSVGLKTPASVVCTNKKELIKFYETHTNGIITKPLSNGITYVSKFNKKVNNVYTVYTNEINEPDISHIPSTFFPTLLQEKINKKFELRIFYLKGHFYPMAIFSQNDEQTKIDFRRYNQQKPNFRVPFSLPFEIRKKLKKMMQKAILNNGSIDMIYSADSEFYFLEVNPVGQFGMVSRPCNYNIEKQIALELSKNEK